MNSVSILAFMALLFGLQFVLWRHLLYAWRDERSLQSRLSYTQANRWKRLLQEGSADKTKGWTMLRVIERHLTLLLETLKLRLSAASVLLLSLFLLLGGIAFGGYFFQTLKGTLLFGAALSSLPYMMLQAWLVHRRMQAQLDFLPAIELFYQCYLVTGERQVKIALQRAIDEKRLLGPMQAVFEQLYRNLSIREDDQESLSIFSSALGHVWADHFAEILRVALTEGVQISDSLRELLADMRKARRSNEQERNRLLEIRIANFSPLLFLAVFVGINIRYNSANAYYYYLVDPEGRDMLLNELILIVLSFLMGLWLSRKKL